MNSTQLYLSKHIYYLAHVELLKELIDKVLYYGFDCFSVPIF